MLRDNVDVVLVLKRLNHLEHVAQLMLSALALDLHLAVVALILGHSRNGQLCLLYDFHCKLSLRVSVTYQKDRPIGPLTKLAQEFILVYALVECDTLAGQDQRIDLFHKVPFGEVNRSLLRW